MIKSYSKRVLISLVTLLLSLAIAVPLLLGTAVNASAAEAPRSETGVGDYDFSAPGSPHTVTVSPSMLLALLGHDPTEAECDYVDRMSTLRFSYDVGMTTGGVKVLLPDGVGDVKLYAENYVYESASGFIVTWVPTSATFENKSAIFRETQDEHYSHVAVLESIDTAAQEESSSVAVNYECTFTFSAEAVTALANLAYNDAITARNKVDAKNSEYEQLSAEHEKQSKLFADYLVAKELYDSKKALFDAYLLEKSAYDKAAEEHSDYLDALAEYNLLLSEYRTFKDVTEPQYEKDYAAFLAYKDKLDYYKTVELPAYLKAEENITKFRDHLKIIDTVKTKMTDGRTLYDAIMGSTVTQVLARQEEIVAAGIPEAYVTLAGNCTENLRELFRGYFSITEEEDKYFYYASHYTEFRDNFYNLLRVLDYFYTFDNNRGLVRTELVKTDRAKKYVILLAQLQLVTSSLYDGKIYAYSSTGGIGREFTPNYTWSYSTTVKQEAYGNATVVTTLQMLENVVYLTDTDSAAPLKEQFPELVEKPEPPTEVADPGVLVKVYEPIAPDYVQDPGDPPTEVEEPTPVEDVEAPGAAPLPYIPTEDECWLIAALDDGAFVSREGYTEEVPLTRTFTLNKKLFPTDETAVYFYSGKNSSEPIYVTVVDSGTAASFRGALPTKPTDARYHYKFSHWVDENGNTVDLSQVEGSHLRLYPEFSTTDVTYTVTWNIDGKEIKEKYKYGDLPTCPETPIRSRDDRYVYTFSTWDKKVTPVRGSTSYTALFDMVEYYTVTWTVGTDSYSEEYIKGEIPKPPVELPELPSDELYNYVYRSWDKAFTPITENTIYTALFDKEYILPIGSAGAEITAKEDVVTVDTTSILSDVAVPVSYLAERYPEKDIILLTSDGEISLSSGAVEALELMGVSSIALTVRERPDGYSYRLTLLDALGEALGTDGIAPLAASEGITFSAKLPISGEYKPSTRLYYSTVNGKITVPFTVDNGYLLAKNLECTTEYFFTELYTVSALKSDGVTLVPSVTLASVGERVTFFATLDEGKKLNKMYYVTEDGKSVLLSDTSFVMPASDVKLWGSVVPLTYKIGFVNYDGRFIERICEWGETPKAPTFFRNSDEAFSYKLLGWDSELEPAKEDRTYTAVYESTPLPPKAGGRTFDSGFERLKYYATLYAINVYRYRMLLIVSFMASIVSTVSLVIFKKYRKKHPIS